MKRKDIKMPCEEIIERNKIGCIGKEENTNKLFWNYKKIIEEQGYESIRQMHNGLHARSNVHLSHVSQSEEDREFLGVEENQLKVRMSSRKGRNMKEKTTGKKRLYMAVISDRQWERATMGYKGS